MRVRRALFPVLGMLALVATACPEQPGTGGTTTTSTSTTTSTTTTTLADADGDGYNTGSDCNDTNPSINPGQTVDTVGDDVDSNCDGQDGIASNVVFVSSLSSDSSTCGDIAEPCGTINQGIVRAASLGRTQIQVAEGTYPKFTVAAGFEIGGHYKSSTWKKAGAGNSNVTASYDATVDGPVGILAVGITTPTKIADLVVNGIAAAPGKNSYGIAVKSSTSALTFNTVTVNGGTAGAGANGAPGTSASSSPAPSGGTGGNGFEPGGLSCNNSSAGAGGGGGSGSGGGQNGGAGGKGGVVDSPGCSNFLGICSSGCDSQPGSTGATGGGPGGTGGVGGAAGTSGVPGYCDLVPSPAFNGSPGSPGANGTNGGPGAGGAAGAAGSSGSLGTGGRGGGGGGGGGANDCDQDDAGAGGGGGGAGGAFAPTAGAGGAAGAKSIALWVENSSPTLIGVQLNLGTGGAGGNGGPGAVGQPGGAGGAGGAGYQESGSGGTGGNGGAGGSSGAGGGGGGGAAIGLGKTGSSTPIGTPTFGGGAGGAGGIGGNNGATGTVTNTATV